MNPTTSSQIRPAATAPAAMPVATRRRSPSFLLRTRLRLGQSRCGTAAAIRASLSGF